MRNNKYSDIKIAGFPEKIASFREGRITAPIYVRVKPINLCNHACRWCVYKADRRENNQEGNMAPIASDMHTDMKEADKLPFEKMLEILHDFRVMGVRAVTYSGGGEPLIYKHICETMERTLEYGIDLSIITNGQLLYDRRVELLAQAKWVRVSMDYTNAAQMAQTRIVPERMFDEVMHRLEEFAKRKSDGCDLGVNYIIHRTNFTGLVDFTARLKDMGVENVRFSPMWTPDFVAYHTPHRNLVEDQLREAQRLVSDKFTVNSTFDLVSPAHSPERAYKRCFFMQTVPVIGADQKVYACHNKAYDETGCIGSIEKQRFSELWFSAEAKAFFEKLNPQCDCRHQCSNDAKNHHINRLVDMAQDNFV